jgi:3'-phosphoadenosine 5'-phosphosulfate sulfotransferase (PAPS reductase)/FAD synthetase
VSGNAVQAAAMGIELEVVRCSGPDLTQKEDDYIHAKFLMAQGRLARAIHMHNPAKVFGLFSGGHDSLTATIIAASHHRFSAAVHINTGIGIEERRNFVRRTAEHCKIKLLEYRATENVRADGTPDPFVYEDLVLKYGFPGPSGHQFMYNRLKERQLQKLERDHDIGGRGFHKRRVLYVSGCRSQESTRRMGHVDEVQAQGKRIWCAPIHDWTKLDTTLFIRWMKLERNPVVDLIHKSGECLCGAFAKPGELEELNMWSETRPCYQRIKALEAAVSAEGKHKWGWEGRPPKKEKALLPPGMLCHSCHK